MKHLISLLVALSVVSCHKPEPHTQTVSAAELDEMLVVGGRTYFTTVGAQSEEGPYTAWGGQVGAAGGGTTFGSLTYDFPKDGQYYIAMKFRNPDGSAFMKVSKYPEDPENPE